MWPLNVPRQRSRPAHREAANAGAAASASGPTVAVASYVLLHTETHNLSPVERREDAVALGWCGAGWTLLTYLGGAICESVRLHGRGAAHDCTPRVAQAVAVRVLAEQGIEVTGWDPPGGSVSFLAIVRGDPGSTRPRPDLWSRARSRALVRMTSSSGEPPQEPAS